jgi:hypothetical protein
VVSAPGTDQAAGSGWDYVVEAHLRVLRAVQPPNLMEIIGRRAGFVIHPDRGNEAASYADVLRYLRAVHEVLGQAAWLSAKLLITHRMRESGLHPELPRAAGTGAGLGAARKPGHPDR